MSDDLIKYRIIHFATHSYSDSMHPAFRHRAFDVRPPGEISGGLLAFA